MPTPLRALLRSPTRECEESGGSALPVPERVHLFPSTASHWKSIWAPAENSEAGLSPAIALASPTKLMRTLSKQSAVTKATQKLHDVLVPDLVPEGDEEWRGAGGT